MSDFNVSTSSPNFVKFRKNCHRLKQEVLEYQRKNTKSQRVSHKTLTTKYDGARR